jgi:hypothetical protein
MPKGGPKKAKPSPRLEEPETKIKIQRFKLEDGREGTQASLGNGLIKLLFDNGDMVIARDLNYERPIQPTYQSPFEHPHLRVPIGSTSAAEDYTRRDYFAEGKNPQPYPLVTVSRILAIVESLRNGQGDPRYAVLMFVPADSQDGEPVNLQYSVINGVVGLDWVLLGQRNIEDQEEIAAFAKGRGHELQECEMNQVKYLRSEGPGVAQLGRDILSSFYKIGLFTEVQLLVEGFDWP